jgi:uncharacterized protein with HEPN domain
MTEDRDYTDFINDIKDGIKNIESFTLGMNFESFKIDLKTNKAVIRCLEEIGEAAKHIPNNIRKKFPDVPWKETAGLRDKLIHFYWGVDLEIVWDVVKVDLQELKKTINKLIL